MKKILVFLLFAVAVSSASAKMRAYLSYTTFYAPSEGAYMETYLSINGKSVKYTKLSNGNYQAKVEVIFYFERNDSIKSPQKIELTSPEITDTTDQYKTDFIDVQRFAAPAGASIFKISLRDMNSSDSPIKSEEPLTINYNSTTLSVSGIQLIEKIEKSTKKISLTKHDYDIYPYLSNFYPDYINQISFFNEVYNTKKTFGDSGVYIYKYYIEDASSRRKYANFTKQKRMKASEIDISVGNFNISKLPSGNYNLVIEILDTTQKVLSYNLSFFQRSNPKAATQNAFQSIDISNTFVTKYNNFDTIRQYIDYLYPILDDAETVASNSILMDQKQNMDSIKNFKDYRNHQVLIMQQFFLDFWRKRNELKPEIEWTKYLEIIYTVNAMYSSQNLKGYLSDRGRVYLKYGAPNSIAAESVSAASYPYEIWHYYLIKGQGNRKFIFYNVDRGSNNFELLHSDVFGEMYEPEWQKILQNRRDGSGNHDTKSTDQIWGDRSTDFWNSPR